MQKVTFDQFFAAGGTPHDLEKLVYEATAAAVDDHSLDAALQEGEHAPETYSAQSLRSDGSLVYVVKLASHLATISSDGAVTLLDPAALGPTRSTFSAEGIHRFRLKSQLRLNDVLEQLHRVLVTHVQFTNDWQPRLVALWIVGTFLHVAFTHFGYLHVTSAAKRCGKSLLLDLLSQLCFNATGIGADPTPAFIFRDVDRNNGTQILDELEHLSDADRRSRAALMTMLNAGFRRGARVPRIVDPKTDSFREYNVYAPRVLASINALSSTVADLALGLNSSANAATSGSPDSAHGNTRALSRASEMICTSSHSIMLPR